MNGNNPSRRQAEEATTKETNSEDVYNTSDEPYLKKWTLQDIEVLLEQLQDAIKVLKWIEHGIKTGKIPEHKI
jgi:hypothetical protein